MAETKPGTPPVRARIGNTGEGGRRQPALCLSHRPRDEELPISHLNLPEPTPFGDSHLGWPSTTPYLGFDNDPYSAISIWFKVDDVGAAIDKLVALGATPLTPPSSDESPGEVIARVRDPSGSVVGLLADA